MKYLHKFFRYISNVTTSDRVQAFSSFGTLALVFWGIFFSPLSDIKESEYKQKIIGLTGDVMELKKEKIILDIDLQKLKSEVVVVDNLKIKNQEYLNNLRFIVLTRFFQNVQKNFEQLHSENNDVKFLFKRIENQQKNETKEENNVSSKKEEEVEEMVSKLSHEELVYAILDDKRSELDLRKLVDLKNGDNQNYDLFYILNNQLNGDEFNLLLPGDRDRLKNKIKIFIGDNRKYLSKPLLIKLPIGWNFEAIKKRMEVIDSNYRDANNILLKLRSYLEE